MVSKDLFLIKIWQEGPPHIEGIHYPPGYAYGQIYVELAPHTLADESLISLQGFTEQSLLDTT